MHKHLEVDSNLLEIIPLNIISKENINSKVKSIAREKVKMASLNLAKVIRVDKHKGSEAV